MLLVCRTNDDNNGKTTQYETKCLYLHAQPGSFFLAHTPAPLCPTAEWNSSAILLTGSLGAAGSTPTFINLPLDVTFDRYRQMYVADHQNHRIQRYPPGSSLDIKSLICIIFLLPTGSNVGTTVAGITGSPGSSLAQLNNPSAIYVDQNDAMYILDTSNCRVLQWDLGDPFGRVLVNGRGCGSTLDRIGTSYAMFIDSQWNIYVSENTNHRVTKWMNGNNVVGQIVRFFSYEEFDRTSSPVLSSSMDRRLPVALVLAVHRINYGIRGVSTSMRMISCMWWIEVTIEYNDGPLVSRSGNRNTFDPSACI